MRVLVYACLLAALTLVFAGAPACNPPAATDVSRENAQVLSASSQASTTPKPVSVTPQTTGCKPLYGALGSCCYDCALPYYIKSGKKVPLCKCPNTSTVRFGGSDCWPYGKIDFSQFNNVAKDPATGIAMTVKSGANNGMYIYEVCVVLLKCTCEDPRKVPQPVYVYPPSYPPVGALGDSKYVNQYNSIVDAIKKAVPAIIPATTQTVLMNTMSKVQKFYTMNGAGDLSASRGSDVQSVLDLANSVRDVNDFTWNDFTITADRYNLYNQVVTFAAGEAHRFVLFYQQALAQQKTALTAISATLPAQLTSTLASADTVLKSF